MRAEHFKDISFPEQLSSNEENVLMQDLTSLGLRLVYSPQLWVWHQRRTYPNQFLKQVFRYGVGRGQNSKLRPDSTKLFHLVPSACLIFTAVALVALPISDAPLEIWLLLSACYITFCISAMLRMFVVRKQRAAVSLVGGSLIPFIHISYGLGVFKGLMRG